MEQHAQGGVNYSGKVLSSAIPTARPRLKSRGRPSRSISRIFRGDIRVNEIGTIIASHCGPARSPCSSSATSASPIPLGNNVTDLFGYCRVYLKTPNVTGGEEFSRCARHFRRNTDVFQGKMTRFPMKFPALGGLEFLRCPYPPALFAPFFPVGADALIAQRPLVVERAVTA